MSIAISVKNVVISFVMIVRGDTMKFKLTNSFFKREGAVSGRDIEMLREAITEQYSDERRFLSDEEFIERRDETVRSIIEGEYHAEIYDDNWLLIEPEFGLGSITLLIEGVEV